MDLRSIFDEYRDSHDFSVSKVAVLSSGVVFFTEIFVPDYIEFDNEDVDGCGCINLASFVAIATILLFMPENILIVYPIFAASIMSSFENIYLARANEDTFLWSMRKRHFGYTMKNNRMRGIKL